MELLFIPLFLVAIIGIIGYVINSIVNLKKQEKQEEEYKKAMLNTGIEQVKNLTPYEFEDWIAKFLSCCGFIAYTTKRSGDYGVDVIAEKQGKKIAIQVKKYSNPLGIKCVQEIIAGMGYYSADEGWVVSTAPYFTKNAQELAKTKNIRLFNFKELTLLLNNLQILNGITPKDKID